MYPAHHNDVRFNFKPAMFGRRCFVHDTYMNSYDIDEDMVHGLGFRDEDLDYELPDPLSAMHWKKKRSPFWAYLMLVIWTALFYGYATVGLKIPQKDNPYFWRKKFASPSSVHAMMEMSWLEDGGFQGGLADDKSPNLQMFPDELKMVNSGLRFNLESYKDLIR